LEAAPRQLLPQFFVFGLSIPIALIDPALGPLSWNLVWIVVIVWLLVLRRRETANRPKGMGAPHDGSVAG
jgi:hypothetical protein